MIHNERNYIAIASDNQKKVFIFITKQTAHTFLNFILFRLFCSYPFPRGLRVAKSVLTASHVPFHGDWSVGQF